MGQAMKEIKEELLTGAEELHETVKGLDEVYGMISSSWEGEAAESFMRKYDDLVREIDLVGRKTAALSETVDED